MRPKHIQLRISLALVALIMAGAMCMVKAQEPGQPEVTAPEVTLLSQIKHQDFARANFNFRLGVRGDSESPLTNNVYDVRFGGMAPDGDDDWIDVPIGRRSKSQIKDLGALLWSDIYYVPILYASPIAHSNAWSLSYNSGKLVSVSPEGVLVKAIVGHIYLVHSKHDRTEFYAMFRVEAIKPEGECTISWKSVPSPETN